jgi:DmsE family decaheme c-type cytochrome
MFIAGCASLKKSSPIMPIKEYEAMLMGRLDANYIGTDNCLASCHYHDKIRDDFSASTMGAQISTESHLPLVNCESCHGPGSLAVEGLTPDKAAMKDADGNPTSCDYDTFIDLDNLPSQAKSLVCLKCHTANATFNLHNWNSGTHAINDVSCFDCHDLHKGPILITEPAEVKDMCLECHQRQRVEFSLPSHHPVMEQRVICTDCHDPHGSINDYMLRQDSVKETCTQCHGEKEGPFLFEHADNSEECNKCHNAHGSVNNNLLSVREPFLCLQCHPTHRTGVATAAEGRAARHTRCTDCHSQIHGADIPSVSTDGGALTH